MRINWIVLLVGVVALTGGAYVGWTKLAGDGVPDGFAMSNGRLEAERIDIATKFPGRIEEILVDEGHTVEAGQIVARMDSTELQAQLREAQAAVRQAREQLREATAEVARRQSELTYAVSELARANTLVEKGHVSQERAEQRQTAKDTADAVLASAKAKAAHAAAAIEAAIARVERLKADLRDYVLKAPRAGRVQYRLAEPGEVLAAAGKVVTILDLTDVYMTVFLPTSQAGRLALGSEARLIFDAAPEYRVPAIVSFVAAEAQFTPKYVETASEREKLMFRVKLQIPRDVLEKHAARVKTGVTGVGYVKLTSQAEWPDDLKVKLPQ